MNNPTHKRTINQRSKSHFTVIHYCNGTVKLFMDTISDNIIAKEASIKVITYNKQNGDFTPTLTLSSLTH